MVRVQTDRNKKKKLKKKLRRKTGMRVDSNLSLYMFASLRNRGYLLFRIDDALEHSKSNDNNNNELLLLPLLVFGRNILPVDFCTLVHIGPCLYFVGNKPSEFFKILKNDLKNLTPSQHNLGSDYLVPIKQTMQGPKSSPLVFVAKDNLYVISSDDDDYPKSNPLAFEMYSPTYDSWKDLIPRPKGHGDLKSHVVLKEENIVYFATTKETVLSYNLIHGHWSIVSTSPIYPRTFCDIHPAFDAPVEIVDDIIFGAFLHPADFNITVAASPHSHCDELTKGDFMRPTLAPDCNFWTQFARRFDYICNDHGGTHSMTVFHTSDGQNVLCFVSYGFSPFSCERYALLTFFKLLGGHWKTSVPLEDEISEVNDRFCYYSRQVEAGNVVKNSYFSSEFMHRKLFNLSTIKLGTSGKLITCFSY